MKKSTLILAGLGSFLLTSFTQLPANLLVKVLPANLPFQIDGISGTLWHGAANSLSFQQWQFNQVRWQLKPAALLKGQLAIQLQAQPAQGGKLDGDCGMSFTQTIHCHPLNLTELPADAVTPYLQQFMVPALKGTLQVNLADVTWDRKTPPLASGHAEWQQAGVQIDPQTFGNYTAILSVGDEHNQQIQISSAPDANYQLDGSIKLQANGQYNTNLNLKPNQTNNAMVTTFLNSLLGVAQPDGSYLINRQGQLGAKAAATPPNPSNP